MMTPVREAAIAAALTAAIAGALLVYQAPGMAEAIAATPAATTTAQAIPLQQ